MRQKKAIINSGINIITFLITFLPNLILQRIFLEVLGEDLRGLNGLYSSIIGWLSIVELGAGTAIVFSLYKPFAEKKQHLVRAYLKFYQNFYVSIGGIFFSVGLLITPFLGFFVDNKSLDMHTVRICFILYLLNSCITYLFSSRLCILIVAQESYKISLGTAISKLLIMIFQIIVLIIYPSFTIFTILQLIINTGYYIVINKYILKCYPWIEDGEEKLEKEEKQLLLKNVKAMFMHKIGALFVFGTDNLLISKFLGLAQLGYYTNYQIIINAAQNLIATAQQGVTASIGNLLALENANHASKIHKKIFFLNFWITSFVTISLYNTLNQFIAIWIGEKYILDNLTFSVILINFYFYLMRGSVERFKEASGNYIQDRYAPIAEGIVNLISSLILVQYMGLPGIFIGTLISNFTIIFWVQPYIVYKYVFKERLFNYIRLYFKYAVVAVSVMWISSIITIPFKNNYDLNSFIINCLINVIFINSIYIIIFYKNENFRYFKNLIIKMLNLKKII